MSASSGNRPVGEWSGRVWLPRWVVYAQAFALGAVTIVAFVFGFMVGQVTAPADAQFKPSDCSVSGLVAMRGTLQGDAEAVVTFLPVDAQVHVRLDPEPIAPATFRPLQNPVIDQISLWGGAVLRTDTEGRFQVNLDAGKRYWMFVISKHVPRAEPLQLSRQEMAAVAKHFVPVEALFRDRAFSIRMVELRGERFQVPDVLWE